jgi:nucleoside-diphosphate-sugar epimerase
MKISVLGCGWLGFALARHLKGKGHEVAGSVTQPEKKSLLAAAGITPYVIRLVPGKPPLFDEYIAPFFEADVLVACFPPSRFNDQSETFHARQMEMLLVLVAKGRVGKLLYTSSTSVYPEVGAEVDEQFPVEIHTGHQAIYLAECALRQAPNLEAIILRVGGLMGYDRIPGKYFAGKKRLKTGQVPVNFIHRDDVIGIIETLLTNGRHGDIYNAVAPAHPVRAEIYAHNARQFGFEMPTFEEGETVPFKIVNGAKVIAQLGYTFKYPDPLSFYYSPHGL